jgi:hypothetical protein
VIGTGIPAPKRAAVLRYRTGTRAAALLAALLGAGYSGTPGSFNPLALRTTG